MVIEQKYGAYVARVKIGKRIRNFTGKSHTTALTRALQALNN